MKPYRDLQRLALVLFLTVSALAQQPAQVPSIPPTGFPGLDQYRASRIAMFTDDFGQLNRYREANAALPPPAAGENRVGKALCPIRLLRQLRSWRRSASRSITRLRSPQGDLS